MKNPLRVRQRLKCLYARQIKGLSAVRIARSVPQRPLVYEKPRFLHAHRDHTDHRQRSCVGLPQGAAYLCHPILGSRTLGVSMNEQQITGIQLGAAVDAFLKRPRWTRETAQIGKLSLDGSPTAGF